MKPFRFEFEPAALEGGILREATLWLAERGVFEWRNNTGVAHNPETGQHVRFGIPGGSDLLCVVPPFGRFLGVETKAKRGRQSDKQATFERAVRGAGGVYTLAKTIEDVRLAFEEAARIPGIAAHAFVLRGRLDSHFADDTAAVGTVRRVASAGHCAVVAFLFFRHHGGEFVSTKVEGQSHWFNRANGFDLDLTGDQFGRDAVRIAMPGELWPDTRLRRLDELNEETIGRARVLAGRAGLA